MATVHDRFDRPLRDLRISLTDRCNFRCRYCMPRELFGSAHDFLPRSNLLSFEELEAVTRAAAKLGVRKVRLTGGEPLLRRDIDHLVAMLAAIDGIEDIALTTNGSLLAAWAPALQAAGLKRVTVSLDTLDPDAFQRISDTGIAIDTVLAGIDAAKQAGLAPVKVNMVVQRGVNDQQILPMAKHFRGSGHILRFIEYMDVGNSNGWRMDEVMTAAAIRDRITAKWPLDPVASDSRGEVARRYQYRDGSGEIGLITSITQPFCSGCTRARLSADGKLYTCLFGSQGFDLRALLRDGVSDEQLQQHLAGIWLQRTDRYSELRAAGAANTEKVEMSYIGG